MRVLVVSHSYPRWDGDVAGAFIERLNLGLVERGHELRVIVPADRGTRGETMGQGIPIIRVPYASPRKETLAYTGSMASATKSPMGLLRFGRLVSKTTDAIRRAAETGPPDVIHSHWWVPGGLAATRARLNVPVVVTLHGTDVALIENSLPARVLAKRVLRRARMITVVSKYLADRVASFTGIDRGRILVRPMPLDTGDFRPEEKGGGGLVSVGRLTSQKRLDTVIHAFSLLRDRGLVERLTLVGDGPERASLESLAARECPGGVEFVGEVTPSDIPHALKGKDAFVFAAHNEGLGLVAGEALMCGVPVVAINSGGVRDLIGDIGAGVLLNETSPDVLATAVGRVLGDSGFRKRAADRGGELSELLSVGSTARFFEEEVYSKAVTA